MGYKRKANKAKLEQFLEYLHSSDTKITQDEYLEMVREKIKECTQKDLKQCQKYYILEKICEVCNDYHHDDQLLLCDYCDDAFHTFCLVNIIIFLNYLQISLVNQTHLIYFNETIALVYIQKQTAKLTRFQKEFINRFQIQQLNDESWKEE